LYSREEGISMVASNRPAEPTTEVTAKALERASEGGRWASVKFNPGSGEWTVPSATDPELDHIVTIHSINVPSNTWWQRLRCSCPAGREGLAVCWHKAAVFIRREQQRREQRYYETATGLGPGLGHHRPTTGDDSGQSASPTQPRLLEAPTVRMDSAQSHPEWPSRNGSQRASDGSSNVVVEPPALHLSERSQL
jgi:hypothetical protein